MPEALAFRARACLCGLASAALLWALAFGATVAAAQEPAPRHWDQQAAGTLLVYIERIDSHGLDPSDYEPAALEQAIASGDASALERQATESFSRVAVDLAVGHVRPGKRGRYYIASDTVDPGRIARLIDTAIAARSVALVLDASRKPPADGRRHRHRGTIDEPNPLNETGEPDEYPANPGEPGEPVEPRGL